MALCEIGVNEVQLTAEGVADPVFGRLPRILPGLQWHDAEVVEPPPGAAVLAHNAHSAVQALRAGPLTWGVQFHLEVGPGTVPKWAAVPEYQRTLAECLGSARALEESVVCHLPAMSEAAVDLVAAFLETAFGITPAGGTATAIAAGHVA